MYHSRDLSDTKSMAPQADKGPGNLPVAFVRLAAEDFVLFLAGMGGMLCLRQIGADGLDMFQMPGPCVTGIPDVPRVRLVTRSSSVVVQLR